MSDYLTEIYYTLIITAIVLLMMDLPKYLYMWLMGPIAGAGVIVGILLIRREYKK